MSYSDIDILVVQELYKDRLKAAAHERLIRDIQQAKQQRPDQKFMSWISNLLVRSRQNRPNRLDREEAQTI